MDVIQLSLSMLFHDFFFFFVYSDKKKTQSSKKGSFKDSDDEDESDEEDDDEDDDLDMDDELAAEFQRELEGIEDSDSGSEFDGQALSSKGGGGGMREEDIEFSPDEDGKR